MATTINKLVSQELQQPQCKSANASTAWSGCERVLVIIAGA